MGQAPTSIENTGCLVIEDITGFLKVSFTGGSSGVFLPAYILASQFRKVNFSPNHDCETLEIWFSSSVLDHSDGFVKKGTYQYRITRVNAIFIFT